MLIIMVYGGFVKSPFVAGSGAPAALAKYHISLHCSLLYFGDLVTTHLSSHNAVLDEQNTRGTVIAK